MGNKGKEFRKSLDPEYYGNYPGDAEEELLRGEFKKGILKKEKTKKEDEVELHKEAIKEAVDEVLGRF